MNNKQFDSLSNETLNSLVDNELDITERAELLAHLQTDQESKQRACDINYLKDRVKTAYSDVPLAVQNKKTTKWTLYAKFASLFFVFMLIGLSYLGLNSNLQNESAQRIVVLDPDGRGQQLSRQNTDEMRVVFHVSNSTRLNADELLDDIESLLQQSIQNHQKVRVEVVAHADGLDLLRDRLSTQKPRIAAMSRQYPELTFVACMNTIARIKREQGVEVKLISDAVATLSGVAYVVMRQQQGWLYIQV